jgi:ATP-dependent helicase Lhr and Lhr-like helicase
VAGFLQRLGRTGRRDDAASNATFLTTGDEELLRALGLLAAWEDGFVEPLVPPALPLHLLAQQLLALVLQHGGVGRRTWLERLGRPCVLGDEVARSADELVDHLLAEGWLFEDGGVLGVGPATERRFGGRNYLDLMAVFSDPPTLRVLAGRVELGTVHSSVLTLEPGEGGAPIFLLGGRSWQLVDVDWRRRVIQVVPAERRGKARWLGGGPGVSFELAQAIRQVLAGREFETVQLSRRATDRLDQVRDEHRWVNDAGETVVVEQPDGGVGWWTFAGTLGNVWLAGAVDDLRDRVVQNDPLEIRLAVGVSAEQVRARLAEVEVGALELHERVLEGGIEALKFHEALPAPLARRVVAARFRADAAVRAVASSPVRAVHRTDA